MRKKSTNFIFDKIMWTIIYLLPIIVIIFQSINGSIVSIESAITTLGVNTGTTTFIYTALTSVFGVGGTMPLFIDTGIFLYLSYFVSAFLCHFIIDITLFVIKLVRGWLDSFVGGDA